MYNRFMLYNWQQEDWPHFRYELSGLTEALFKFAEKTGHISGLLTEVPKELQNEATLNFMVEEAVKTSEIEGEYVSRRDVQSSIRNYFQRNKKLEVIKDQKARNVAQLMLCVREGFLDPLSQEILFQWHHLLFSHVKHMSIGQWREHLEPMQVVSGSVSDPKIHFEAPPSKQVPKEMKRFIQWFNVTALAEESNLKVPPVRSAIAHLYFESIHPFEDGNGRIGRVIAEKALSQSLGRPVLFSLSKTIEANRKAYYEALKKAQQTLEITEWISYFLGVLLSAQEEAQAWVNFLLSKTRFFDRFRDQLNERQQKIICRMLEKGPNGFKGGISARKYISLTGTSKATATRDLQRLAQMGILLPIGFGRNAHYELNFSNQ